MALEVLKDVKEIGGFELAQFNEALEALIEDFDKNIIINHATNTISFTLQNGPVKEVGVTGCQIQTLIEASLLLIEKHNEKYPCYENVLTINALKDAIAAQKLRTAKREARGVEGKSEQ